MNDWRLKLKAATMLFPMIVSGVSGSIEAYFNYEPDENFNNQLSSYTETLPSKETGGYIDSLEQTGTLTESADNKSERMVKAISEGFGAGPKEFEDYIDQMDNWQEYLNWEQERENEHLQRALHEEIHSCQIGPPPEEYNDMLDEREKINQEYEDKDRAIDDKYNQKEEDLMNRTKSDLNEELNTEENQAKFEKNQAEHDDNVARINNEYDENAEKIKSEYPENERDSEKQQEMNKRLAENEQERKDALEKENEEHRNKDKEVIDNTEAIRNYNKEHSQNEEERQKEKAENARNTAEKLKEYDNRQNKCDAEPKNNYDNGYQM